MAVGRLVEAQQLFAQAFPGDAEQFRRPALVALAGVEGPLYHWGEIHAGYVGADRVARFCPCHDADELGLPYNLHTDAPITPVDPLIQVCTAVTRTSRKGTVYGPDQAVTVMSALKAVTIHAAFPKFEEHVKGSLTPGKYADMVLLAENPLKVAPEHIKDIAVLRTYVGGDVVYSRS